MARKTFFSFHYERDVWRVGQVRNCNLLPTEDQYGFIDSVEWESIRRQGEDATKRWIREQLKDTSVTAVLIGAETAQRPWVHFEIVESWNRGNGLVGVWIHNIKNQDRKTDVAGSNPFDRFKLPNGSLLSRVCKTYDWALGDGRNNLGSWIEEASRGRSGLGAGALTPVNYTVQKELSTPTTASIPASVPFVPRSPWCS